MKRVEKTEGSIIRGRTKTEIVPEVVECVTCEASIEKDGYDSKVAGEKQLGTKLAVTWKWNIESWTCNRKGVKPKKVAYFCDECEEDKLKEQEINNKSVNCSFCGEKLHVESANAAPNIKECDKSRRRPTGNFKCDYWFCDECHVDSFGLFGSTRVRFRRGISKAWDSISKDL